jgi:hypothetical protein
MAGDALPQVAWLLGMGQRLDIPKRASGSIFEESQRLSLRG